MIEAVTAGSINAFYATMAMTAMFVIYGVAGGLSAAILTDFIQGILTIVLSFLILPFAFAQISHLTGMGAMEGLRATIADPEKFSLVSKEVSLFFIVIVSLNGLIGYGCQPHTMGLCAAGKTEMEARVGMTCGMFIKRFCTVAWVLTGLCALAYYMILEKEVKDVDHIYGLMARDLLPVIAPGLVGLFIASMLAGLMSSCDAFMVAGSALFTENVYRKVFVRNADDRHYMIVGRSVSVLVVAAAILFAFSLESVVKGLEIFWKISAMMGLAFWAGLFWRRTTVSAVWVGTLVTFAAFLFTGQLRLLDHEFWNFNARYAEQLPELLQKDPDLVPQIPAALVQRLDRLPKMPETLREQIHRQPNFTYALKTQLQQYVEPELDKLVVARRAEKQALEELAVRQGVKMTDEEIANQLDELDTDIKLLKKFDKVELPELALPWQIVFYLSIGLVTIVAVSLATPRVPKEKLDRFYSCLRTPVEPDEPETEAFTLPPGVEPAPRRVVCDFLDLEIPKISMVGLLGVLFTAVAVAALIAGVYWVFGLGA